MSFEPQIAVYTGRTAWNAHGETANIIDLRETVMKKWPDLKLPAGIVLLPQEDFAIMNGDLQGTVYTPHRMACMVTVLPAPKVSPARRTADEWLRAIGWLVVWFLGVVGFIDCLNAIVGHL